MIKKDIAYSNSYIEPKREKFQENCNENHHMSVDDIFADADRMIYEQNQSLLNQNPKKKKRKRPLLRLLLTMCFVLLLIVGVFVGAGIYSIKTVYPQVKAEFITQMESIQNQLTSMDDSLLTTDQYYQKQILMLFSMEDIEGVINNIEDIQNFAVLFDDDTTNDLSFVPQEKIEEYQQIIEEYQQAKQEEAATAPIEAETTDVLNNN